MSPGRVLVLFAFYVAALDLGAGRGLVEAVASPPGLLLLGGAGLLFAWRAVRAARAPGAIPLRIARVLVSGGAAVALVALPASLVTRDARTLAVGEGEAFPPGVLPGLPGIRVGEVRIAPRGAHVLSKTVSVEVVPEDGPPATVALFPPTSLGPWSASIFRFGYGVGLTWLGADGGRLSEGRVMLGTLPHREEESALVSWSADPNVMMGAGTFPPRLEELVSSPGASAHLFLRLEEATIAGVRRDLRDPNAYRWLADGRLENAVLLVQAFRGKEKVFEGRVRAGEAVRFPGGALALERDVPMWVDLLATRDPLLPWAAAGLAALALGAMLRVAVAPFRRHSRARAA